MAILRRNATIEEQSGSDFVNRTAPRHRRRSIRLQNYDYAQAGAYFVTLCVHDRACRFGNLVNGEMQRSEAGQIVAATWDWLALQYSPVELDAWVMMPNHVHGIIVIGDHLKSECIAKRKPLSGLVGAFKTVSTKRINELRQTPGEKLWQRNYWEHVIRNEAELTHIREYIQNNPIQWELDSLHPCNDNHRRGGSRTAPTPDSERYSV
ncbi:hypothetical protein FACS1894116_00350 [Betaproteobacteria bacterium]|nr:hypothetical protein FACS1894116_00350 [Betaproteobacteria bacterium]GHT97873.1 hypothetical protein FACS1894154_02220 [Betaproteobacteria bacterium]GHU21477.1 hypothetical protein FACS189488_00130 [Betaproteobacteria bacterium]